MNTKTLIRRLTRSVVEALDPDKVVLFGSQAKGKAHADSDVDLLIIMESDLDRLERTWQVYRLLRGVRQGPLDIIVLTPEEYIKMKEGGYSLIQEVEEQGTVLYERVR